MADEAENPTDAPAPEAHVPVSALKAILEAHAHDFIGRAFQIVDELKAAIKAAEEAL